MAKKKTQEFTTEERLQQALVPEEEWPYELPQGWRWVTLGKLTDVVGGGTPSTSHPEYYENGDIPWLSPADLSDYTSMYISHGQKNITKEGLEHSSTRLLPKGTVCLSSRAPIGYVVIANNELCTNQGFKSFTPSEYIFPEYLYWYLKGNKPMLESMASGTTFLELSGKKAGQIKMPLPPFEVQKEIAAFINKEFSRLDEAKDQIQSVLDSSEERKQSILHKAFTGELTRKWRAVNNTRYEWGKVELITVLREKPRNGKSSKPVNYQTKVKSMTLSAVTSGIFNPKCYKYVDINIETDSYLWLKPGDVLIERSNSLEKVGTSALFTGEDHDFIYPDLMMKLQTNERILPEFLAYQLKLNSVMQYFRENATGTAGNMPKINQTTVSNAPILLPTIEEQKEIVRIIDQYMQKEIASSEVLNMTIDQIEETRTSVLSHAFHGELNL